MIEEIKNIMSSDILTSELYCVVKKDDDFCVKKINSHENLDDSIVKLVRESVNAQYLSEEKEILDITEISNKKDVIYKANLQELKGLSFMSFEKIDNYQSIDGDFKGFIIKVSNGYNCLYCFQYIYPTAFIKRHKKIPFFREEDQFKEIKSNILVLEGRIDFICINKSVYVQNWKLLESKFKFTDFIKSNANDTISSIKELGLLKNLDKLLYEAENKLPTCKQLMKAKNSEVLKRNREVILTNAKSIEQYTPLFDENGELVANTVASVKLFIKLLNDDMLYSKLTEESYDASDKVLLTNN